MIYLGTILFQYVACPDCPFLEPFCKFPFAALVPKILGYTQFPEEFGHF